jgi:hypothetical protein
MILASEPAYSSQCHVPPTNVLKAAGRLRALREHPSAIDPGGR